MTEQPIDPEVLRQIDAKIDALLAKYPALREPNPEREAALAEWLETLDADTEEPTP